MNLREIRKRKGYTAEEIAKKIGVTRPTVTRWETGVAIPNMKTLKKLSNLLEVSMDDLIGINERVSITVDDFINGDIEFTYKNKKLNERQEKFLRSLFRVMRDQFKIDPPK